MRTLFIKGTLPQGPKFPWQRFQGKDLFHDTLMNLAKEKFKPMKDGGTWNAPSKEEEQILALEAKLKANIQKFSKAKVTTKFRKTSKGT